MDAAVMVAALTRQRPAVLYDAVSRIPTPHFSVRGRENSANTENSLMKRCEDWSGACGDDVRASPPLPRQIRMQIQMRS